MKEIHRIVITGGPCAGKTSAFARIEAELSEKGYKVFMVPETFTEMYIGGIRLVDYLSINFQSKLLNLQVFKEEMYNDFANLHPTDKVVILYDRGVMDGVAYMDPQAAQEMFERNGYTDNALKNRYDAVIHMVTAADGAEEAYIANKSNNKARYEDVQQAIEADRALIAAWTGHPHLRIVDNSTDFNTKISRVVKEIFAIIGQPVPMEIEKKYLVAMPDFEYLKSVVKLSESHIVQTYLCEDGCGVERRIRQRGKKGDCVYYYTEKQKVRDGVRIENERLISEKEYLELLFETDFRKKQITKTRYCFVWNNMYFELDVYPSWDKWAILEIELTEEKTIYDIEVPGFIDVIKDVTGNEAYSNYSLATRFPCA